MDPTPLAELLVAQYQLRLGRHMQDYLLKQLASAPRDSAIPIIGGNARTGVAVRQLLAAGELQDAMTVPRASA